MQVEIDSATIDELRALRLYHWGRMRCNRRAESAFRHCGDRNGADVYYARANHHLKAVQTLNVFFPELGDTAERDAANQGPLSQTNRQLQLKECAA